MNDHELDQALDWCHKVLAKEAELIAEAKAEMAQSLTAGLLALANGKLYIRDQDVLFCYDVKGRDT